jgi:hypothetical protein
MVFFPNIKRGTLIFFRPVLAPAKGGKPELNASLCSSPHSKVKLNEYKTRQQSYYKMFMNSTYFVKSFALVDRNLTELKNASNS